MTDYKNFANKILELVGGKENVLQLEHCATRLRFVLEDKSLVKLEDLQKLRGVVGVVDAAQFQVVVGADVDSVFDEIKIILNGQEKKSKTKQKISTVVLDFIVGVFQPLVPALAGAGILKAVLTLFTMAGLLTTDDTIYQFFFNAADSAMYFLPLAVAVTTATKLGSNRLVALSLAGSLVLPNMMTMMSEGMNLFGFQVQNINYTTQAFPIILAVLVLAFVEKKVTKICPKPIRAFMVPMVCYVVVAPLTFLVLGPIGHSAGVAMTTALVAIYDTVGWIAVGLLAAVLPLMISFGMHKPLVPYLIATMSEMGYEIMYACAALAHNIAESGACFAVAIRTKNKDLKAIATSGGISALFGITEPALYGVTIQNKRVLASVSIGSAISGVFFGIMGVKCFVVANPGLASLAIYADINNSMNIVWAIVGTIISLVSTFIITLFLYEEEISIEESLVDEKEKTLIVGTESLMSVSEGTVLPLTEVNDDVFSACILGKGIAIIPEKGELYAPANGHILTVTRTKHAITMVTEKGAELLIHVGLDTVRLDGKYFEACVKDGEEVKAGQLILKFDIDAIKAAGYDITTPIIVTNTDSYEVEIFDNTSQVTKNNEIIKMGTLA